MNSTKIRKRMGKIKQEFKNKNQINFQHMSSCMYQQQHPIGHMVTNASGTRAKMFRFHMTKENSQLSNCRRRLDFNENDPNTYYDLKHGPQVSVARRNERERNRVKLINMTFATLRDHLPYEPESSKNKKMSKVDTLKAAINYIKDLQELVDDHDAVNAVLSESCNMDTCVRFSLDTTTSHVSSPEKSPTSASMTSERSFDGLSNEEEELMDFANWF